MPIRVLLGGIVTLLGKELREGTGQRSGLTNDLVSWAHSYQHRSSQRLWTDASPDAALTAVLPTNRSRLPAPQPPPRGRHRLSEHAVAALQRERIIHATATVMSARGYAATSVADIVAHAGVSREVFYRYMRDKRDALNETVKLFFEQTIAAAAGAFFTTATEWPERVWQAGRALADVLASAPAFARVALIESYAPGIESAVRVDEMLSGFTIFLEDGFRLGDDAGSQPRSFADAITAALVDLATTQIRQQRTAELPALTPLAAYITLAPFTGPEAASEFALAKRSQLLDIRS
jgi:AcrR family transcriptional regulator